MTPRSWASLAVVCLVAIALHMLVRDTAPIGRDISGLTNLEGLLADRSSPASGPGDAAVSLVVFTDYRCPACRKAHPAMIAAAREAGDVRIIYRDFPIFGPPSQRAAHVALAARRQGLYARIHDAFMRETRALDPPVMRAIVERAGGDWARIVRDMAGDRAIERQLQANREDALRLGVSGTPTYLIGPYLVTGALDEEAFMDAFAQARRTSR